MRDALQGASAHADRKHVICAAAQNWDTIRVERREPSAGRAAMIRLAQPVRNFLHT
jgi:hypothetical protein